MNMTLQAGSAVADITPHTTEFLYGYPHVERYSTGVHDPLLSCALYLGDGQQQVLFIANDTIFVTRQIAQRVRAAIQQATEIPADNIMITATHTHSGPLVSDYSRRDVETDAPDPDPAYAQQVEAGMIRCALDAYARRQPAQAGLAIADATGIGTNRHDPSGPADPRVPVLIVRNAQSKDYIAAMLICCMHPTVLHEDSTLISGDFPAMARQYLQNHLLGANCPVLHHTGPAGDQSPRHVTRGNTFAEANRLGQILGQAVAQAIAGVSFSDQLPISSSRQQVDLPRRLLPSVAEAQARLDAAANRLADLRLQNAASTQIRTAECDWFGAEEALALSQTQSDGRLERMYQECLPAEVQVLTLGPWSFVGWPCEVFVEFGLQVRRRYPNAFVISLANGELRGYLVTQQAVDQNWYEAGNALMQSPIGGERMVETTLKLLAPLSR